MGRDERVVFTCDASCGKQELMANPAVDEYPRGWFRVDFTVAVADGGASGGPLHVAGYTCSPGCALKVANATITSVGNVPREMERAEA
jgi:hypothetical protein